MLLLLEIIKEDLREAEGAFQETERQKQLKSLQEALLTLMCNKLLDDDKTREKILKLRAELETAEQANNTETVTKLQAELRDLKVGLCSKWAPREKKSFFQPCQGNGHPHLPGHWSSIPSPSRASFAEGRSVSGHNNNCPHRKR